MKAAGEPRSGIRVWDPLVRLVHWSLAASIAAAWLTRSGGGIWHERIGYVSLALIAVRVVMGFIGSRYARFSQFVRAPAATLRYAGDVFKQKEQRHIGHNPLGGWMILALIVTVAVVDFTGWLYTTNAFWGEAWLEELHYALAVFLLVLVALHIAGVIAASLRHRENLVAAMIHGRKRAASGDDKA